MNLLDLARMAVYRHRLMKTQWWDSGQLRNHQDAALRTLLQYAGRHSAFYRRLYADHGVDPESIKGSADLTRLPIVDRARLQAAGEADLTTTGRLEDAVKLVTSGSTGLPFAVRFSREEFVIHHRASFARVYREYGRRIHHKVAYLSIPSSLTHAGRSWITRVVPHSFTVINCAAPIEEQIEELLRLQPDVITGYTISLGFIARELSRRNITSLRPKLVYAGAETLSESVRKSVRKAFATELLDTYNCMEVGNIAWECPSRSGLYHLNDDLMIVETVDAEGRRVPPGVSGEVVVTSLFNKTQPLIRYRLGDMAKLSAEPCPCGRGLRSLERIEGRRTDAILMPDQRLITAAYFDLKLSDEAIVQYQVRQTAATSFLLLVVRANDSLDLTDVMDAMRRELPGYTFALRYVNSIEVARTGKFRTLIPLIRQPAAVAEGRERLLA